VIFRGRDIIRVLDEKQEAGRHDCHAGDDASYAVVMMTVFFGSHRVEELSGQQRLHRTGILMALAISIHNFPEGLATFASALGNIDIAIPIVIAIAIHNIPEGIAVSVPIYQATGSHKKAFWYSLLSGMAEPVGALIGFLFLLPFWTPTIHALLLAFVSGIEIMDTDSQCHQYPGTMQSLLSR